MSGNKSSTKLRLSVGSSHNDTLLNKEHLETAALTSSDIEWQWTSPVGTVSNVNMRADKTPLQQMKKPCQSISPVSNNFPRKRKLIKIGENETEFGSSVHPTSLDYVPVCDPELAVNNACEGGVVCPKEDYCTLFDDGEDAMDECLVQLSQTVENSLSQTPKGIIPLEATTPSRSTRVHSALTKTSVFSPNPSKAAIKQCIENNFPRMETMVDGTTLCASSSLPPLRQGAHTHIALHKTVQIATPAVSENTKYEINDSFDDILLTFCEENVELLSQPTNERHILSKNSTMNLPLNLQSSTQTSGTTKAPESTQPPLNIPESTRPPLNVPNQRSLRTSVPKAPESTRPPLNAPNLHSAKTAVTKAPESTRLPLNARNQSNLRTAVTKAPESTRLPLNVPNQSSLRTAVTKAPESTRPPLNAPNLHSVKTAVTKAPESTRLPLNVPNQSSLRTAVTKAPESSRPTVSTRPFGKSSNSILFPVSKCDKTLDDDFLQPDLLKLLESVEANSQPKPASHTLRCTPQEIENKRREAKMKLERKKIALKNSLVHI